MTDHAEPAYRARMALDRIARATGRIEAATARRSDVATAELDALRQQVREADVERAVAKAERDILKQREQQLARRLDLAIDQVRAVLDSTASATDGANG